MSTRTYPYDAWVLMPSFKPKQVTLVKQYGSFGGYDYGDLTEAGKNYARSEIHATKAEAIAAGRVRQTELAVRVAKLQATYDKRQKALDAAGADQ